MCRETQTLCKLKNVTLNSKPGFNLMLYKVQKQMGFNTDLLSGILQTVYSLVSPQHKSP